MAQQRPIATLDLSGVEGTWKEALVSNIHWIDGTFGTHEWTTRQIGLASFVFMVSIHSLMGEKYGIRWYALSFAVVSGYLSLICVCLNVFAAEHLTGTTEPLRSILCQGPLTSLHRHVPAIAMGYGLLDIYEGMKHGVDFVMHGIAMFTIMAYFSEYDVGEIIVPTLLMEISTPFLHFLRFELFGDAAMTCNMVCFVVTFFFFRLIVCPYLMWEIFITVVQERDNAASSCLPWHFAYIVFIFQMFFNFLNAYWAYRIILKVKRKLSGKEKMNANNNLGDHHDLGKKKD